MGKLNYRQEKETKISLSIVCFKNGFNYNFKISLKIFKSTIFRHNFKIGVSMKFYEEDLFVF
jgi:hypothetical protein